ncbi:pyridoxamine 5'-phosphate oxidase family protein [Halococcoides cellulosivorans]|uniref:Pyridoxamine 5'-phosphate oxidase n=1 Tax=Halococcoides cellulosivorans TaxID=1679096 RepID=A0A2R4X3F0_9EURY|nr:pyridoxamine 5'-phosphate oxidase family protein [Halococcoides cellulosivorans]AWB28325.1 pyridoxamine 5'-phosphate oxidase [Halococcoides cellulosivorans]
MGDAVPPNAEKLLESEPLVGHLATSTDDRPHVAPVWYCYEDGTLDITTTGQKLADVRANPRVAFSVQRSEDGIPEWQVTLRGTATVVEDPETTRERNRSINEKYGVDPDAYAENTLVRIDVGSASYETF